MDWLGAAMVLVSLPVVIWGFVIVRREEARRWHMWVYMAAGGFLAFGAGWVGGFGLFGVVFFPIGVVLAWLDSYLHIGDADAFW